MAAGGKAYGSRFSNDRLCASTAHAWGSGTGDTNCGSLLLNLVANRSTCGWCHREHIALNTSGWRDHSVWMVWPSLDSLSAITFSRPGIWRALRVTCFLVHQDRILHNRAHREPDFIPPSLLIQATTVVLSVATRTMLFEQRSWNSFKARKSYQGLCMLETSLVALTNQSSRYWWVLIPLWKAISLTSLATTVNCAVDRPKGRALNW